MAVKGMLLWVVDWESDERGALRLIEMEVVAPKTNKDRF